MSYPANLTDEQMSKLMKRMQEPVPKGTVFSDEVGKFKTLEDSTAHGCPWVEVLEHYIKPELVGTKTTRTLYMYSSENL